MTTTKIKFALAVIATLLSFAAVVLGSCQRAPTTLGIDDKWSLGSTPSITRTTISNITNIKFTNE